MLRSFVAGLATLALLSASSLSVVPPNRPLSYPDWVCRFIPSLCD